MLKRFVFLFVIVCVVICQNYTNSIFIPETNYRELINIPKTAVTGKVDVAVIDQGFDADHPAISDSIFRHDYHEKSPEDHGLGVVGVLCAVAPGARIHYYENYFGYDALESVLHSGCKILNISWGNPGLLMVPQIQKLVDRGVIIVKSAGNEGIRIDGRMNTISWSELAAMPEMRGRIIIAGSADEQNGHILAASFSNYAVGGSFPMVYAPGKNIKVLSKHGKILASGTSYSAPQISGALALLMEKFPGHAPEWYVQLLQNSSTEHNGIKLLNVKAALQRGSYS